MHAWLSGVFLSVPDQGGWGLAMAIPKLACCAVFRGVGRRFCFAHLVFFSEMVGDGDGLKDACLSVCLSVFYGRLG